MYFVKVKKLRLAKLKVSNSKLIKMFTTVSRYEN